MQIFKSLEEVNNIKDTCIALGKLNSVHKGHQQLIKECVLAAKEKALVPSVFTFTNHPVNEMAGKVVVKNIMNFEEKAAFLEGMGVEYLFSITFDEFVRQSSPQVFLEDILLKTLRMKHAVCGFNYHFGYKAAGDGTYLHDHAEELGYGLTIVPEVVIDGNTVSSTLIRGIIDEGRMEDYEKYTGRLYTLDGTVVQGRHLGRRIGFPTVNLSLNPDEALPPNGVYVT
ncbi:MAG: bifunctional riboflavin kinase/FMN adenylyltransferase, partial [Clostridia bacterium]|nr:bifunctional riboflavin kinase/FMN adenylyltransferase [Clostridia bacterium]